jgi:agmatine deiminase
MSAVRSSSFFMPAEWIRHTRTILAWPGLRNPSFLDRNSLATATEEVSCIADAVARFEPVTLLVGKERMDEAQRRFVVGVPGSKHQIHLHPVLGDEMNLWMRDIAPTFVVNKTSGDSRFGKPVLHGIDFNFNGWGNRHPTATCTSLAHTLLQEMPIDRVQASIVTEGGALEIDGEGTLLATES